MICSSKKLRIHLAWVFQCYSKNTPGMISSNMTNMEEHFCKNLSLTGMSLHCCCYTAVVHCWLKHQSCLANIYTDSISNNCQDAWTSSSTNLSQRARNIDCDRLTNNLRFMLAEYQSSTWKLTTKQKTINKKRFLEELLRLAKRSNDKLRMTCDNGFGKDMVLGWSN